MIDLFQFKNHRNFHQCPICLGKAADDTASVRDYMRSVCIKNCKNPLNIRFIFKKDSNDMEENKIVSVAIWREQYLFVFRLDEKMTEFFPDRKNLINNIKINLNSFDLESLTDDKWESTIKTLLVFN